MTRGAKAVPKSKTVLLTTSTEVTGHPSTYTHTKESKQTYTSKKINLKGITKLNVKCKTNFCTSTSTPTQNLDDVRSGDNFLDNTMKARSRDRQGDHAQT